MQPYNLKPFTGQEAQVQQGQENQAHNSEKLRSLLKLPQTCEWCNSKTKRNERRNRIVQSNRIRVLVMKAIKNK